MEKIQYICPKCGNMHYVVDQFQATGGNFAKIFDVQNKKFQDWQEVRLAVDFGYYMQFIERYDEPTVFYLSYNGLMIRPTVSVRANLYLFRVELGLYYQSAVYPRYSDYDGFGLYIKLF